MCSSLRRSQVTWSLLTFVWFLSIPVAALAQNPSSYKGIQRDEFMRRWLVLGAIPITSDPASKPDEEAQKKAFATDWLVPHGVIKEQAVLVVAQSRFFEPANCARIQPFSLFPDADVQKEPVRREDTRF